jgi:hypothetical protein
MPALGVRMTVLAGRTIPVPLPPAFTARVQSVKVTENDEERSVFTLTFDAGRSRRGGAVDVPGLRDSPVPAFARVVVVVTFGTRMSVLSDGIVTDIRLTPGDRPGAATLEVTGEDISYLLDRVERTAEHPALADHEQVVKILAPYQGQGIVPNVVPPVDLDRPLESERVPTQQDSDLAYLTLLARRHGYVVYVIPGPAPGTSRFYWGPPVRVGPPQPVLSVDLGPDTTFTGLTFHTEALAPATVTGAVFDSRTGKPVSVRVQRSERPPLAALPLWREHPGDIRQRLLRDGSSDAVTARARAQADVDRSIDAAVATGTVDGARYGHVLRPRGLVGVRGAGWSHDGLWYVRQVVHTLSRGSYRQQVTLAREGLGSTVLAVPGGGAA